MPVRPRSLLYAMNMAYTVCPRRLVYWDYTVCPRSSEPFYIVIYYIKWVTNSWAFGKYAQKVFKLLNKWVTTSWTDSIITQ